MSLKGLVFAVSFCCTIPAAAQDGGRGQGFQNSGAIAAGATLYRA
jgi:hypothetical protein